MYPVERGLDSSCSPNISHQDAVSLRPKPEFLIVNKRICPVFQKKQDLALRLVRKNTKSPVTPIHIYIYNHIYISLHIYIYISSCHL